MTATEVVHRQHTNSYAPPLPDTAVKVANFQIETVKEALRNLERALGEFSIITEKSMFKFSNKTIYIKESCSNSTEAEVNAAAQKAGLKPGEIQVVLFKDKPWEEAKKAIEALEKENQALLKSSIQANMKVVADSAKSNNLEEKMLMIAYSSICLGVVNVLKQAKTPKARDLGSRLAAFDGLAADANLAASWTLKVKVYQSCQIAFIPVNIQELNTQNKDIWKWTADKVVACSNF